VTDKASSDARARARNLAKSSIHGVPSWTAESLAAAVLAGKRDALAQAITWVESTLPEHQARNEELLRRTHRSDRATQRLGITGIPGAGKSTLIEQLGMDAIDRGHRVAVLAVDPSSTRTKGSLLGDKTRMQSLSMHPDAFVRPSSASGTLGGVARATSEAIQLCEAAGFDLILVETVGVGQSEVTVRDMVDIFVLTLIGGAGDDVQGIKRGVVEMCDILLVHKCDGDRVKSSQLTAAAYSQALHLLPMPPSGTPAQVVLASSLTGEGIGTLWDKLLELRDTWTATGWWTRQRAAQRLTAMHRHARQLLVEQHMQSNHGLWEQQEERVTAGTEGPFSAARKWVSNVLPPPSDKNQPS
jgi:LAO/AO transport system kinase